MSLAHVPLEEAWDGEAEELRELERVQALLAREDVEGARRLIEELAVRWPVSEPVRRMAAVMIRPRVIPAGRQPSRKREMAWLRQNARNYPGCWIALYGDTLIAAGPDVSEVKAAIQASPHRAEALLHFQPGSAEPR